MTAALDVGGLVSEGRLATIHRGCLAGRAVAVKRARPEVPGAAAAMRRERRVLGAARHPALVPVLDFVDDPETPMLVLGWADGGSVADLLADGPLSDEDVLHLLRPVAGALDALHRAGAAHLDVSPRNVLLAAAGPILIDPAPPGSGTPGYTDPAVAVGGLASARSDVFGLAALAHVALTGRHPGPGGGMAPGLVMPAGVAAALAAGLDRDPRRRPASATELFDRLEAALAPEAAKGSSSRPPQGRPVARSRGPSDRPPCTWPFERWQEEADTAAARQARTAADRPGRRRRLSRRRADPYPVTS